MDKRKGCLIIDKCRRQKLCKRVQKISAAAPLRVISHLPMLVVTTTVQKNMYRCWIKSLKTWCAIMGCDS